MDVAGSLHFFHLDRNEDQFFLGRSLFGCDGLVVFGFIEHINLT
jgi:hypothetical protein